MELATGKRQAWRVLIPADPAGVQTVGYVVFTPEGKSYVYYYSRLLSDLFLVEGLK